MNGNKICVYRWIKIISATEDRFWQFTLCVLRPKLCSSTEMYATSWVVKKIKSFSVQSTKLNLLTPSLKKVAAEQFCVNSLFHLLLHAVG